MSRAPAPTVTLGGKVLFPSLYVAAADLPRDVTLTISRVVVEGLKTDRGTQNKPIVYFAELEKRPEDKRKKLVLNKTNARTIARMYGGKAEGWIGKRVTLHASTCEAFGETVDCIRIRANIPPDKCRNGETQQQQPPSKQAEEEQAGLGVDEETGELSADEEAAAFGDVS